MIELYYDNIKNWYRDSKSKNSLNLARNGFYF